MFNLTKNNCSTVICYLFVFKRPFTNARKPSIYARSRDFSLNDRDVFIGTNDTAI